MLLPTTLHCGIDPKIKIVAVGVGYRFWYLERQPHKFLMNAGRALATSGWLE
jgi:hypothetical protein